MTEAEDVVARMAGCGACRKLAVEYGLAVAGSRHPRARARDWDLPLTSTRIHLEDHLITTHPEWLPDRQPDCETCDAWHETSGTTGPICEPEALHRAWHLCAPLHTVGPATGLTGLL
ncbi:hypothetical protein ACF08W_31460 [Streptomyces sp. NPDC015144]|uniref:hypothetical protein n=1 Tax=Streptomyces sp. NPDC015144 TaxID=3364944 RepID=UPI00370290B2